MNIFKKLFKRNINKVDNLINLRKPPVIWRFNNIEGTITMWNHNTKESWGIKLNKIPYDPSNAYHKPFDVTVN